MKPLFAFLLFAGALLAQNPNPCRNVTNTATAGQVLSAVNGGNTPPCQWISAGGGGSGTVTSVGLALPNIFNVTGSPVTTTGTLTGALATQSANLVFAGPTTGAAAAPTFRSLVAADIPALSTTVNGTTCTIGSTCTVTVPISTGVTGLGTGVATFLATPSSANLLSALTTSTGTGNAVFSNSPTLVTPALGTPSALVLTNATSLPCGAMPALTGDTTSSAASCATTTSQINGGTFPLSAVVMASNASRQPIAATLPLTFTSGGTGCAAPYAINPQTATYQVVAADFNCFKTITVASGTFTITLVASGSQPAAGTWLRVINYGSGVVTIARSGQNINGAAANYTLAAGSASAPTSTFITSDATNYFANNPGSGSGGANPAGSFSEKQYRVNGTTFGAMTNTAPVPTASWVMHNASGAHATLDDFNADHISLNYTGNVTPNEWALATQTLGGTPYTVIAQLRFMNNGLSANNQNGGLCLYDGTKLYAFDIVQNSSIQATLETRQLATITSAGTAAGATVAIAGYQVTLKVNDNGTNRIWSYWSNGAWVQFLSETTATFLTPNAVGICGVDSISAAVNTELQLTYWCSAAANTCAGQ